MPDRAMIRAALEGLRLPDGSRPLSVPGALSEIVLDGGKVSFAITVSPGAEAAGEALRQAAERAARAVSGVEKVLVSLTAERAPSPGADRPGAASLKAPTRPPGMRQVAVPGIARIVAVASGKGGVGKSTSAVNLAIAPLGHLKNGVSRFPYF
jgi:ATP-binding protein involved in chromosome partitioning